MTSTPVTSLRRRARHLRAWAWFPSVALLIPLAACSSSPQSPAPARESLGTRSSALDPNQVFTPTSYTIKLSGIHVSTETEPYNAPNMTNYGGLGGPPDSPLRKTPGAGSCGQVCAPDSPCNFNWTPDTGFRYWAQIGFRVQPTVTGSVSFDDANFDQEACGLGAGGAGNTLGPCTGGTQGGAIVGQPLTKNFTVNPRDQVFLAIAVDNVESVDVSSIASSMNNTLQTDVKDFGDGAKLVGAVIGAATSLSGFGSVFGVLGSAASVTGDFLSQSAVPGCSASTLAMFGSSCVGGLVALPTVQWNYPGVSSSCRFTAPSVDTIWVTNPLTGQPYTAEDLQALTAAGDVTLEFTTNIDTTSSATDAWCSTTGRGSLDPLLMAGCASQLKIDFVISRQWNTGLAASAKSGDIAVVRTPGGALDAFAEDNYSSLSQMLQTDMDNQIPHYEVTVPPPPSSSAAIASQSSELEITGTDFTVESLQSQGVNPATVPVVVSRTPQNLDLFWADSNGALETAYESFADGVWHGGSVIAPTYSVPVGVCQAASVVPPNASLTATARTPDNLDVFFVGTDGNVYNAFWTARAPTWGYLPTTTGSCWGTACAGSGQPGGGVAAVARMPWLLDVFYIGRDGGLWTSYWSGGAGPSSWTTREITGPNVAPPGAQVTAVARTTANLDVFFVGYGGTLMQASWQASGGTSFPVYPVAQSAGVGQQGGLVSAVSRQPSNLDVVFAGKNGELEWSLWTPGPGWSTAPVKTQTGATLGAGTVGPGGLSVVASDSYSLEAFYLNPSHQLEAVWWSDPAQCDNDPQVVPCSATGQERLTGWKGPTYLQDPPGASDLGHVDPCAGMYPPPSGGGYTGGGGGSSSGGTVGGHPKPVLQ